MNASRVEVLAVFFYAAAVTAFVAFVMSCSPFADQVKSTLVGSYLGSVLIILAVTLRQTRSTITRTRRESETVLYCGIAGSVAGVFGMLTRIALE